MKFKSKWRLHVNNSSKIYLNIVADACITSTHFANGKNIPLVIIDTTNYENIEQALTLQSDNSSGYLSTIWGKTFDSKYITLTISLIEPSPAEFTIAFDTEKNSLLIDLIVNSQLLYIQPGKPGDRFSNTIEKKRLLIEVPSKEFKSEWDLIFSKITITRYRKLGLNRNAAKKAVTNLRKELLIIRNFRLK